MSVDTRTPRTPTGGRSSSFDDEPVLSSVKVPCDPAQVIVNHASFRVRLAVPVVSGALADTTRLPVLSAASTAGTAARVVPAVRGATAVTRRRAPVLWSGGPDGVDPAAADQLRHAVQRTARALPAAPESGAPAGGFALPAGATQVLPRVRGGGSRSEGDAAHTALAPSVVGPRDAADADTRLLQGVRPTEGAYDDLFVPAQSPAGPAGGSGADGGGTGWDEPEEASGAPAPARRFGRRPAGDSVRHAYYPGHRMNLGVVLLPLRVFLGFISIYAGMGKLCDPVYFDGGERGSMVTWLNSLHPWALAAPLRDFALAHPVGAGLTVAFLQVVVGVLTMFGLWQRAAAVVGALLSTALLVTVTWRTVPAYETPDIIYLAAWSPLVIAGAPVFSLDARLAGEAWRTLGPRVEVAELRRRVLRRGGVMTAVVAGLTLLVGSLLGGAVRSASVPTVPGPGEPPVNNLQGSPLPQEKRKGSARSQDGERTGKTPSHQGSPAADPSHRAGKSASPEASAPGTAPSSGSATGSLTTGGSAGTTPGNTTPQRPPTAPQQPSAGGTGSGGGTSGGGASGSGSGEGDAGSEGGSDGGSGGSRGALSGLLGG
ncbi:DoxX family membrane protein [Streptomyces sp. NPDC059740]|uniref:DoxX family protein n=1 Tax=Streptomyces sp. NPDC059740 TaxID=3346926 RepID=UPI003662D2A5